MKKFLTNCFVPLCCLVLLCNTVCYSQNSILVTLGSNTCSTPTAPIFSLIRNPLGASPSLFSDCDLSQQLPDYFFTFIAYNPENNKIYIDDTRTDSSKVWVLDMGLPNGIACPDSIPVVPTYHYPYVPNNFEFDNNGNLWSFSNYVDSTGLCTVSNFDVTNGNIISSKTLAFPLSNPPTDLNSGDVSILPNGRMFVVFGQNPSRLYEITNYNGGSGNAIANYLQTMPLNTYGMAYVNGELVISGTNTVNFCYYFDYNISSNTILSGNYYQLGETAIDNTSIDPIIGDTKDLASASLIDSSTANISYDVYVRNMGNVILNNVNVSDNLATAFGAANVSNVTTSFISGFNNAGLVLNPSYNGTTDTMLLNNVQELPNQISIDSNYFFEIQINCTVSNLVLDSTYYNSAIAYGNIDSGANIVNVTDSSNNGTSAAIDPNNDNNPDEIGENTPTPLTFTYTLPVHFINISASFLNNTTSIIQWSVGIPTENASKFEVEYSTDAVKWYSAGSIPITNSNQSNYQYEQTNIPSGNIYYRIQEVDANGMSVFSRVVLLQNGTINHGIVIYPNPANDAVEISMPYANFYGNNFYVLTDALGRVLEKSTITNATTELNTQSLTSGTYWIQIESDNNSSMYKIIVTH